jgi:competence protein ComEC
LPQLSKAQIFFGANLAFLLGVVLARWWTAPLVYFGLLIVVSLIAGLTNWQKPAVRNISFWLLFLFLGLGRYQLSETMIRNAQLAQFFDQPTVLVGWLCQEPDVRLDQQWLTVCLTKIDQPLATPTRGKVLVRANLYPQYFYGQNLQLRGRLRWPSQAEAEIFSYQQYLKLHGWQGLLYEPQIKILAGRSGNFLTSWTLGFKQTWRQVNAKILPEPEASFLAGLLLGERRGLPEDLQQAFKRAGVMHILAISGYNISIIIVWLSAIAFWFYFSRREVFWLLSGALLLFVCLTGASASVVRAALMGWLVLLAQTNERLSQPRYVLALAAALMTWINPRILWWDVGWQLSFAATWGLLYLAPQLEKRILFWSKFGGLRSNLISTLSAIVLTLPLSLYYFGQLSVVAPLANLLILPLVPLAMASGFGAWLFGWWWPAAGQVLALLPWAVLHLIIWLAQKLTAYPAAAISWQLPGWGVWLAYFVLLAAIYFGPKKKSAFKAERGLVLD